MFYALTINTDQIITGVHESGTPITTNAFSANAELSEDTVVSIPSPAEYQTHTHILCYNENGTRKSDVWCIENGFMELPPYAEIIDGELIYREMPPEEASPTLEEYFATMVNEAKAEAKALVDAVQEEAYQQVTQTKEALSNSLAEVNDETEQKFTAMRPIMTELVKGKPADIVISTKEFILDWVADSYEVGDVRRDANGYPKRCITLHNSITSPTHTIDVASLWASYHATQTQYALPYVAPTGAHDMYKVGEYMIWTDGTIMKCIQDTAYSPTEYAQAWETI